MKRAAAIALVAVVVALVFPVGAAGYTLNKSTNGVIIERESTDPTATVSVALWYDYKAEQLPSWDTVTYQPFFESGSYRQSRAVASLSGIYDSIEVPLAVGYRYQMVKVSGGGVDARFAVLNEPMDVSVVGTPSVNVESAPPVSLDSSVSIADTITASISDVGGADATGLAVLGVTALCVGGWVAGVNFSRRNRP